VSFIDIYNENEIFIGSTSDSNFIDASLKRRILNESNFVTFKSSFYEPKKISINEILNTDEILLHQKIFALNEVVITKNDKVQFLKISGYYRSTQLNNNEIQYFNDGKIEYYIDLKNNKINPQFITNRAYVNKEIKQITRNLHFSVVGVPNIYLQNFADSKSIKIKKNDALIEKICVYNDSSKIKEMGFLGHKSILTDSSSKSIFNDAVDIENLLYFSEIRKYKIKSKKDKEYTNIEALHEFFVTDVSYSDTKGKSNCRFYVFNKEKKYDYPFWKDIKNIIYENNNFTKQKFNDLFEEIKE
jgi:hypothetical protein